MSGSSLQERRVDTWYSEGRDCAHYYRATSIISKLWALMHVALGRVPQRADLTSTALTRSRLNLEIHHGHVVLGKRDCTIPPPTGAEPLVIEFPL